MAIPQFIRELNARSAEPTTLRIFSRAPPRDALAYNRSPQVPAPGAAALLTLLNGLARTSPPKFPLIF
jgi:hypothetical protein